MARSRIFREVWVSDSAWSRMRKVARERLFLVSGHGPLRGCGSWARLRIVPKLMPHFCYSHFVDATAGEVEFAIWSCHDMANYAAA